MATSWGGDDNEHQQQQGQQSGEDFGKLSFIDPPIGKKTDRYVRSLTASEPASPLARLLSHSRTR